MTAPDLIPIALALGGLTAPAAPRVLAAGVGR